MPRIRERIRFSGRVQGVFFRATCAEIARSWPLSGYVRNLDDGAVEMEVQGDSSALEAYLTAVQERYADNIRNCERRQVASVEGESGFVIRY